MATRLGESMNRATFDNAIHAMEVLGGSFVKSLAECYCRADTTNKQRLRDAFPEIFVKYELVFEQTRRSDQ